MSDLELGKLESVHPTAPVYLQRAAILAILSFVFFLAMLIAFTVWQNFMYFWMATAFLIVELFTLFGWFTQRKNVVNVYAGGFTYKKQTWRWNEIEAFQITGEGSKRRGELQKKSGEKLVLTETIAGVDSIFKRIKAETARRKEI